MNIVVRIACLRDLNSIQDLNLKLFKKEYAEYDKLLNLEWTFGSLGTKYFKDRITKGFVALADVNGQVIGYICAGFTKGESYRKMPKTAELENMFILEQFRSK
ncbi:MAG: GNAT family N-acetyltransferase [Nanoarchaeota archaeon]